MNERNEIGTGYRDEFLSEEDLALKDLSFEELVNYWNFWLEQAQATNSTDENSYSHSALMSPELYDRYYQAKTPAENKEEQ